MKNIVHLGRDIESVIIVDNNIDSFQISWENGIYIKPWIDDSQDKALVLLEKILTNIVSSEPADVRILLKKIHNQILMKYQVK